MGAKAEVAHHASLEHLRKKNRQQSEKGNAEESVAWIKGKGASKKLYG